MISVVFKVVTGMSVEQVDWGASMTSSSLHRFTDTASPAGISSQPLSFIREYPAYEGFSLVDFNMVFIMCPSGMHWFVIMALDSPAIFICIVRDNPNMLEDTSDKIRPLKVSEACATTTVVVSTIKTDGSSVLQTLSWQIVSIAKS